MMSHGEAFIGIDAAKLPNAVAEAGRDGEIRYLGEIDASAGKHVAAVGEVGTQV